MPKSSTRRLLFIALLAVGITAIAYTDARNALGRKPARPTPDELKAAFPAATSFSERDAPYHHWLAFAGGKEALGAVFLTTEVPPDVKGYVGPVPVLVGMDRNGVIARLIVLENRETPYYMRMIERSGFFKKFVGRSVGEGLESVDAVSGATITSRAIVKDVSSAASLMAKRLFGIESPARKEASRKILPLASLILSLALGMLSWLRMQNRRLKWASFAVSILTIGLYLDLPLSFSHITSILQGDFPPWSNLELVVLLIFVAVTTLIWGPMFCGHVCPFGGLQEILWRAVPGNRLPVTGTLLARLASVRWIVLFALILLAFPLNISEASGFEPYPYLFDELHRLILGGVSSHSALLRLGIWAYALLVLIMSARVKRFWCRIFCPTGSCLLLLSPHRKRGRILSSIQI